MKRQPDHQSPTDPIPTSKPKPVRQTGEFSIGTSGEFRVGSYNKVLDRLVEPAADDVRVRRAEAQAPVLRRYTVARYGAKSWRCERRVAARIEATTKGLDIRFVVTNIEGASAEWLYDTLYCARGQADYTVPAARQKT